MEELQELDLQISEYLAKDWTEMIVMNLSGSETDVKAEVVKNFEPEETGTKKLNSSPVRKLSKFFEKAKGN